MASVAGSQPKELLSVGGRSLLRRCLEEAAEAGCEEGLLVVSPAKRDPFDAELSVHPPRLPIRTLLQESPLGLAHAVNLCRDGIGDEPFVLCLADHLHLGKPGAVAQVIQAQAADGRGVWALIRVDAGDADGFGNSGDVELEPWGLLKSLGPKKPGTFEVPDL